MAAPIKWCVELLDGFCVLPALCCKPNFACRHADGLRYIGDCPAVPGGHKPAPSVHKALLVSNVCDSSSEIAHSQVGSVWRMRHGLPPVVVAGTQVVRLVVCAIDVAAPRAWLRSTRCEAPESDTPLPFLAEVYPPVGDEVLPPCESNAATMSVHLGCAFYSCGSVTDLGDAAPGADRWHSLERTRKEAIEWDSAQGQKRGRTVQGAAPVVAGWTALSLAWSASGSATTNWSQHEGRGGSHCRC